MTSLRIYDGKRVAVVLNSDAASVVVKGTARYEEDEFLGQVLRVLVEQSDSTAPPADVLIAESEWNGEIKGGDEYDCEFCFFPSDDV